MQTVKRFLVLILLLVGSIPVYAQEDRPALVCVPSMQAEIPGDENGNHIVYAIVVVPSSSVMDKNATWLEWERMWPTKYSVGASSE